MADLYTVTRQAVVNTEYAKERWTLKLTLTDLGQGAYFSATLDKWDIKRRDYSQFGIASIEDVRHAFTEYEKYLQWHLVNVNHGPLHYIANALYWAGCSGYCNGEKNDPPNWDHFCSTIIYGAINDDRWSIREAFDAQDKIALTDILNERFSDLMQAFDRDMVELFGDIFKKED